MDEEGYLDFHPFMNKDMRFKRIFNNFMSTRTGNKVMDTLNWQRDMKSYGLSDKEVPSFQRSLAIFKKYGGIEETKKSTMFSDKEIKLLSMLPNSVVKKVKRGSDRDYDVHMKGLTRYFSDREFTTNFSGWLPLASISEMIYWTHPDIARMTDHPIMARQGDWSGVRDSSRSAIYQILKEHVEPKIQFHDGIKTRTEFMACQKEFQQDMCFSLIHDQSMCNSVGGTFDTKTNSCVLPRRR